MSQLERAKSWERVIHSTRRKVNCGWWLQALGPLCIGWGILAASTFIYLRTQPWFEGQEQTAWISAGVALILLPLIAWLIARGRFVDQKRATVRLESEMGLHNALTAATHDVSPWPEPPQKEKVRDGLDWNWTALAMPPVVALILVATSMLIPISPVQATADDGSNEPRPWNEMDDWLDKLEEEKVADQEVLDQYREAISELRDQPKKEWFSHSSLEASDSLRQNLQRSINDLEKNLSTAERSLSALEKHSENMSESARNQMLSELNQAMEGMEMGNMPLNEELMNSLKQMDPSQMNDISRNMSAEQMQKLQEQLKKNAEACKQCTGGSSLGSPSNDKSELQKLVNGESMQQGFGEKKPGRGGITRGPGDAPMSWSDDERNLHTSDLEAVSNMDLERAAPGDTLGIGTARPDIKEVPLTNTAGGGINSSGSGGETVWEEELLPDEREVLKRYFQ